MYSHYLRKWIGFCLIIAGYFIFIRPLRAGFLSVLIPMIEPLVEQSSNVEYYRNTTALYFNVTISLSREVNVLKDYTYMMAFNSYYLFASLGLSIINDLKSSLFTLSAIHATSWITATIFLFAGLTLHPNWWIGSNLITVYLLPLASMALVAIRYAQQLTIASR
jgi:hypothetical protein